jgi:hypothetical protein
MANDRNMLGTVVTDVLLSCHFVPTYILVQLTSKISANYEYWCCLFCNSLPFGGTDMFPPIYWCYSRCTNILVVKYAQKLKSISIFNRQC